MYCSVFVFIPRDRFIRIIQLFSVFSVSLWQNHSATYWSGMYTTLFCISFMVSCVHIHIHRYFLRRENTKKDQIGKVLALCGFSLK